MVLTHLMMFTAVHCVVVEAVASTEIGYRMMLTATARMMLVLLPQ